MGFDQIRAFSLVKVLEYWLRTTFIDNIIHMLLK